MARKRSSPPVWLLARGEGVIHLSALGVEDGSTPCFTSKQASDQFLKSLPLEWRIVRPALIYGMAGKSAQLFRLLASLPLLPLPAGGQQPLRPTHIDDLCAAVAILLDTRIPFGPCIDLVGATETTLREMLATYRDGMGFPPTRFIPLPAVLLERLAPFTALIAGGLGLLTPDTWKMLQAGNTADAEPTAKLLGRQLRALPTFIAPEEARQARLEALVSWRGPLFRLTLALIWLVGGIFSLFVPPMADSRQLLARTGLGGIWALVALYTAAGLDLVLSWATLATPGRRLWILQLGIVSAYSLIVAVCLPEFLTHPFGPILKNLSILCLLVVLFAEEPRP